MTAGKEKFDTGLFNKYNVSRLRFARVYKQSPRFTPDFTPIS